MNLTDMLAAAWTQGRKVLATAILNEPDMNFGAAIFRSIYMGDLDLFNHIVEIGKIDINQTYEHGNTAVNWAGQWDRTKFFPRLKELGADLDHQNEDGAYALLSVTIMGGRSKEVLKELGARDDLVDRHGRSAVTFKAAA
ncbi:MAG: hypothetical protein GC129_00605 [Proteobacteria bacterium]|nr:hypothetical protein [Pseudomonadota bacterium]